MNVRTRIAPSPTGYPHIGTIYQVLFDWAYAKKNKGQFILRVEDTDQTRFIKGAEEVLYKCLSWFNITPDEDPIKKGPYAPYRQSERLEIYYKHAQELIKKGHAYYCFCTKDKLEQKRKIAEQKKIQSMYDGCCRQLSKKEIHDNLIKKIPYVIRMKIPENRTIVFSDLIMGKISFESSSIDDQVLIKSDGFPTYHLAVVVDDYLMKITHIFRGREWVSSTPKHILLYEYFGWEIPKYAHLPLILNADGKGKLSKRFNHASVDYYREKGYLPQALLNYLSNIVWNHPGGKEIYTMDEFISFFDITQITSQGARFDLKKLDWINGEYIRATDITTLMKLLVEFYKKKYSKDFIQKVLPLVHERIKTLSEFDQYCHFFIQSPNSFEIDMDKYKKLLTHTAQELEKVNTWNGDRIGDVMQSVAQKLAIKNSEYFMVIRIAITGKMITPPLNQSMEILGKEDCIKRLYFAVSH